MIKIWENLRAYITPHRRSPEHLGLEILHALEKKEGQKDCNGAIGGTKQ